MCELCNISICDKWEIEPILLRDLPELDRAWWGYCRSFGSAHWAKSPEKTSKKP